jgi:hypothetical protein
MLDDITEKKRKSYSSTPIIIIKCQHKETCFADLIVFTGRHLKIFIDSNIQYNIEKIVTQESLVGILRGQVFTARIVWL